MYQMIEELTRIAKLSKTEIGENENNVKFKFIIPLLKCFGYSADMDFEHSAQGNRIDIYIGKQSSCGIVVEAKSYNKNLDDYISQLKRYSDDKRPLLAIISNGEEIRFYSPFWRGTPNFSETILYSIKRVDLNNDEIIRRLEKLLSKENLDAGRLEDYIQERENEIRNAKKEMETLEKNYKNKEEKILIEKQFLEDKRNEIKTQISEKDKVIRDLKNNKEESIRKLKEQYRFPKKAEPDNLKEYWDKFEFKELDEEKFIEFAQKAGADEKLVKEIKEAFKLQEDNPDKFEEELTDIYKRTQRKDKVSKNLKEYWDKFEFEELDEEKFVEFAQKAGADEKLVKEIKEAFKLQEDKPDKFEEELTDIYKRI